MNEFAFNVAVSQQTVTPELSREAQLAAVLTDALDHSAHVIECITVVEHMGFCLGNAIKYIWREDLKNDVEDLKKAVWYLQREIEKRERAAK